MKALAFRLILIISILNSSSKLLGHVALDYPVGGETYIQGQTVTIQWHIVAFHQQLNWDLYFSADGGDNWQPIQLDIPVDSLSYTWVVPAVVTSQGRIKIFQDNVEHDYLDVSGDFNIVPNTSPPSWMHQQMMRLSNAASATRKLAVAELAQQSRRSCCHELLW